MIYQEVLQQSKKITRTFGENYYQATSLFPKKIREAVFIYYAWTRIPDEFVDGDFSFEEAKQSLESWIADWEKASSNTKEVFNIHYYMNQLFVKYNVPKEYGENFLRVMEEDLYKNRYVTYQELESYMYGSATVVGLTMLCFFGLHKPDLLPGARAFAEAMQLTNFLRDIKEDYEHLGRIYLPEEDRKRFGVTEEDIKNHSLSPEFQNLMKFEIDRARSLYKKAWPAIQKLPWKLRFPIKVAGYKYQGILDEIEKANYDIWSKRHRVSRLRKLFIIIQSLI
jgi:phytoene synthase